ncbi:hypothetical protein LSCM1_08293 [Leishmania martiniquensis]|uniref:Uncharacterized protein n=1 Tax=Leishmania martiniquensis TaxID=1580590 RepID=A0A836FJQ7_9TRYP|nr:hypothetical protein LSCM1_08293 [Leishmania martiniquensis]
MWALTSRPIQNAEALQLMEYYKKRNALQSNKWLLPRHLASLAVRPRYPAQLVLPADSVIQPPLRAVPFFSLPSSRKRDILDLFPPPYSPLGSCLFLECIGASMRWRPASTLECFDAAFVYSDSLSSRQHLLCTPDCAPSVTLPEEVTVYNAQETTNPFLVDDDLVHRSLLDGRTFQHNIASSLTTIAAQFNYTSFDWVEAAEISAAGLRVCAGASPHLVNSAETLRMVHISQLPSKQQKELVNAMPRFTLIKSMSVTFIFQKKRWYHHKSMQLRHPLLRRDVPCCTTSQLQALQPLLWVAVDLNVDFPGVVTERERLIHRLYYNSQQLEMNG